MTQKLTMYVSLEPKAMFKMISSTRITANAIQGPDIAFDAAICLGLRKLYVFMSWFTRKPLLR